MYLFLGAVDRSAVSLSNLKIIIILKKKNYKMKEEEDFFR
jgi:hypothetical protein